MLAAEADPSESTLPRGWSSCTHVQLNATCYVHTVSRVCTWSRPRVVDTDVELEQVAMPEAEGPLVSRSLLEEQRAMQSYWDRRRSSDNAREVEQLDPKERLQRELCSRPQVRYGSFKRVSTKGEDKIGLVQARLLERYCWDVLGARVDYEECAEPEPEGGWPYTPPTRTEVRLLGVVVSQGLSSGVGVSRSIAIEAALWTLCPLLWLDEIRAMGCPRPRPQPHPHPHPHPTPTLTSTFTLTLTLTLTLTMGCVHAHARVWHAYSQIVRPPMHVP